MNPVVRAVWQAAYPPTKAHNKMRRIHKLYMVARPTNACTCVKVYHKYSTG